MCNWPAVQANHCTSAQRLYESLSKHFNQYVAAIRMRSTFCLVRHLTSFNWILPPLLLVNTLLTRNKHTHWYRESMQRFTFIGGGSGRLYLFCWWAIFEIQSKRIEFSIECHGIDSVSTLYFILLVGGNVKSTYSLARADTSVCCRKYRTLLCILSSVAHFSFARYCYYFPNNVFRRRLSTCKEKQKRMKLL